MNRLRSGEAPGASTKDHRSMTRTALKALAIATVMATTALSLPATAEAGHGWGHGPYWHGGGWGGPGYWSAGLIGLGVGAAIGSALAAPAYVGPPPVGYAPPPAYAAAGYGPAPWSPEWYDYCGQRYRSFNAHTGYFTGYDGLPHFCQ
jgi:hypothetical protein